MPPLDITIWSVCSDFGSHLAKSYGEESGPLDSLLHKQKLEKVFCNDFICCGQYWANLHHLLQHCEECHADDDDDDDDDISILSSHDYIEGTLLTYQGDHVNLEEMEWEEGDDDEEDDDIQTPLSPLETSFLPRHITSTDLTALENYQKPPIMRPSETQEEYGYEKIKEWMQQAKFMPELEEQVDDIHRPYRCQVPDCDKAYKNANGLKYHKAHGHCHDSMNENLEEMAQKPYMCSLGHCRKRYKNLNGLKYHIQHGHFKNRRLSATSTTSPLLSPLSPPIYSIHQ
ncbi:hypothetical protein BC941DRAFT_473696 [Chlamydoabsidia padenii]|nr:hypothetical protein BC941DRAFT_473696 [Chlamydoabsidia padenii]